MIEEIIVAISIGVLAGIFTGLTPGIHINLVSVSLITISPFLLQYTSPLIITVMIIAMGITHTFLDAIPSIFLGAPDPETALLILPGHKMMLKGKGYEAVILTVIGSIISLILAISAIPVIIQVIQKGYPIIENKMGLILLITCTLFILREKQKLICLIVFLLSGTLGLIVLTSDIKEPLFPLLSGLFGISTLLMSLKAKIKIPIQIQSFPILPPLKTTKAIIGSLIISSICSMLPGLGPAQATIILTQITKLTEKTFLVVNGCLNTVNMLVSVITFYIINKARNGAIASVMQLVPTLTKDQLIMYIATMLIAGGLATILTIQITKGIAKQFTKLNYKKICFGIMLLILILVAGISKFQGIIVVVLATLIGLIPQIKDTPKNHLMGSILLPVTLYFLF